MTDSTQDRLKWAIALAQSPDARGISESHGLVTGLVCGEPAIDEDTLLLRWSALHLDAAHNPITQADGDTTASGHQAHLSSALEMTQAALQSDDMDFELLVPASDQSLTQRTEGLAHWCTGFLAGFGASGGAIRDSEASEALSLLGEIARATNVSDEADGGIDEGEEEAFFELVEFVKVAVLLLHEDRRLAGRPSASDTD